MALVGHFFYLRRSAQELVQSESPGIFWERMNGQALSEIRRLVEEVTNREGCYLYDLEFVGGAQGRVLRVYIDKEAQSAAATGAGAGDSEGSDQESGGTGVSVQDCTNVSRGLNEILDNNEEIVPGGNYSLEVSSPGLERVLKEPRHFERALGKKIFVKTFAPVAQFNEALATELGKAKQVQGALLSFDSLGLKVEQNAKEVFVPFDTVTKAHVVFEFTDPSEKKKGKAKK